MRNNYEMQTCVRSWKQINIDSTYSSWNIPELTLLEKKRS